MRWCFISPLHRYFATLQKELETYDCVLYEMVASRESLERRRTASASKRMKSFQSRGFNILGFIQRWMARILTLDFQLDCLDYQADNWCHADLDYETFKQLQVILFAPLFFFPSIIKLTKCERKQIIETVEIDLHWSLFFSWFDSTAPSWVAVLILPLLCSLQIQWSLSNACCYPFCFIKAMW